jgi:hypothetical protein
MDDRSRQAHSHRHRNGSAASPNIGDPHRDRQLLGQIQSLLNQELSLGTGDQGRPIHMKVKPKELALAQDIGQWLPLSASLDERPKAG